MKKLVLSLSVLLFTILLGSCNLSASKKTVSDPVELTLTEQPEVWEVNESQRSNETKIQVAILLDVSGSMDGLIEQAKSRLWNIVNTLTTLKYKGETPRIEIALYSYGMSSRLADNNYMRQITPLTTNLDLISQKLFELRTSGSEEYCGTVISRATKELEWGTNDADIKLIYIAGNEIFEQGPISYRTAIPNALEKKIYVNTIHCGNMETGIRDLWRDAAERGRGKFFNIDSNARISYIETPYDDQISRCNERLNTTYISYGRRGAEYQANQVAQDRNASSISKSNYAERAVSKSSKMYDNSNWDLVDMTKNNKEALSKVAKEDLPKDLQGKTTAELEKLIAEKEQERNSIQKEIAELAKKRQAYIDEKSKEGNNNSDLGIAINKSILAFATEKGYTAE